MFLHWADFFCLLLLRHNLRIVLGPLIKVATMKINFKLGQKVDPLLLHHLLISFSSYQIWGDTNLCQTRPALILLLTKKFESRYAYIVTALFLFFKLFFHVLEDLWQWKLRDCILFIRCQPKVFYVIILNKATISLLHNWVHIIHLHSQQTL